MNQHTFSSKTYLQIIHPQYIRQDYIIQFLPSLKAEPMTAVHQNNTLFFFKKANQRFLKEAYKLQG